MGLGKGLELTLNLDLSGSWFDCALWGKKSLITLRLMNPFGEENNRKGSFFQNDLLKKPFCLTNHWRRNKSYLGDKKSSIIILFLKDLFSYICKFKEKVNHLDLHFF